MTRAIVIDDDHDEVSIFCEYLELKGIEVVGEGYNGNDAVELYQSLKPDIVFLDVMMPNYDGFYALEKIRKMDPTALVVMVTADVRSGTKNRIDALKASAIFFKPYDLNKIMVTIRELIDNKAKLTTHNRHDLR